ncbi:MAG: hypothetical protein ACK5LY_09030 [Lachnospirales bacterium]
MKINNTVEINSNLTFVTSKFIDVDFYKKVTKNIHSCEITKGNFGEVGSIMRFTYNFGNKLYMEEQEVIESSLPQKIVFKKTLGKSTTIQENIFEAKGGSTLWTTNVTYELTFLLKLYVNLFRKKAFIEDTINAQEYFKKSIEEQ